MAKSNLRVIDEDEYGLYVWVTNKGERVVDEEGRTMNIPSRKGDRTKIEALRQAAAYYGFPNGRAVFMSGRRQVTDDEWDNQQARLRAGLIPDPLDHNAMMEEAKYARKNRE